MSALDVGKWMPTNRGVELEQSTATFVEAVPTRQNVIYLQKVDLCQTHPNHMA